VLWVVCELLHVEKPLFVRSEDKVLRADDTLQYPIREIHRRPSDTGETVGRKTLTGSSLADRQNHIRKFKTGARAVPDK